MLMSRPLLTIPGLPTTPLIIVPPNPRLEELFYMTIWLFLPTLAATELRALVAIPATEPCTDLGNESRTPNVLPTE